MLLLQELLLHLHLFLIFASVIFARVTVASCICFGLLLFARITSAKSEPVCLPGFLGFQICCESCFRILCEAREFNIPQMNVIVCYQN